MTGATSRIGARTIEELARKGTKCIAIGRRDVLTWRLGQPFPTSANPNSHDVLIHLAHDRTLSLDQNKKHASQLFETFPGFIIFASSLSAHSKSRSLYGKSKLEIEKLLTAREAAILKIGLYLDKRGGFFKYLLKNISTSAVIPLPNRGIYPIYCCSPQDLTKLLIKIVESRQSGTFLCASDKSITLRQLIEIICLKLNRRAYFVPIPRILSRALLLLPLSLGRKFTILDSVRSTIFSLDTKEISSMQSLDIDFLSPKSCLDSELDLNIGNI